jgi:hypothetical protein
MRSDLTRVYSPSGLSKDMLSLWQTIKSVYIIYMANVYKSKILSWKWNS